MPVIVISGKQGSGKSTLQQQLCIQWRLRGGLAQPVNFADIIYEMHNSVLGILDKYYARDVVKDGPLLQMLGTEWGRNTIDEQLWVKCTQNKVSKLHSSELVVIGDCRFPNELAAFPNAFKVRLECPEDIRKSRCNAWRDNSTHPSEIALDKYKPGDFDMLASTNTYSPELICEHIWRQLNDQ